MMTRPRRGARVCAAFIAMALVSPALAGCSVSGEPLGLDAVADEREARAQQRVETLLANYGDYLASRWPGIRLPETQIEAWLDPGVWTLAFERCASEASGLAVRVDPVAGVVATPAPQTAGQRRDFDTAIYLCQGRLPPPNLAVSEPGPVEIAWVTSYARDALPSCLRREGVAAPPLPDDPFAILDGGSTPGWDPYAAARDDQSQLQRVRALCPHPSVLLSSIPPLSEASS